MEIKGSAAFFLDSAAILPVYPGLKLADNGLAELVGIIVLYDKEGKWVDEYQVRIKATEQYPKVFPLVFETGEKIPVNIDWHVYESDGHLCICTLTDEFLKTANGLPLISFIKEELEPYLFNQTHRRESGFFLHEMKHGIQGQLQSLQRHLGTTDINNVCWLLDRALDDYKMDRTSFCFCGSRKKYRHCHRDILDRFKGMGSEKLKVLRNMIIENMV